MRVNLRPLLAGSSHSEEAIQWRQVHNVSKRTTATKGNAMTLEEYAYLAEIIGVFFL